MTRPTLSTHNYFACSEMQLHTRERVLVLEAGRAHTPHSQGSYSSNLGPDPVPNRVVLASEQRRQLTSGSGHSPSISSPVSYQGNSYQPTLQKTRLMLILDLKTLGTPKAHTGIPLQDQDG